MFAFEIMRIPSQMALFAAEPSTWLWIVIALVVLSMAFRRPRRMKQIRTSEGRACRPRRGFPWKTAVLVALVFLAFRHFGSHRVSWDLDLDLDLDEGIQAIQAAAGAHDFPRINSKDLWALRRKADQASKTPDKQSATAANRAVARKPAKRVPATPASQETRSENSPRLPYTMPPHVARSVTQARELADRAVEQARTIAVETGRNVVALKALTALKFAATDEERPTEAAESTNTKTGETSTADNKTAADGAAAASSSLATADTPIAEASKNSKLEAPPTTAVAAPQAAPTAPEVPEPSIPAPEIPAVEITATKPAPTAVAPQAPEPPAKRIKPAAPLVPMERAPPEWLQRPSGLDGDVYYETVVVERYATAAEAEDALAEELQNRTRAYIDRYLGPGASKSVTIPPAYVHDHLVKGRYDETVDTSVGPMINAYARLSFDRRARATLQRLERDARVEHRLLEVSGGAAVVLLVLGAIFGYLKLDTMTRGYYTRRLQLTAAVVILTVAAGALFFVRSRFASGDGNNSATTPLPTVVHEAPLNVTQLPTG
ncbi:MAG: hypothetical protein ABUL64_04665 [Singulisphaera sp.]